jgi:hypothetical protein
MDVPKPRLIRAPREVLVPGRLVVRDVLFRHGRIVGCTRIVPPLSPRERIRRPVGEEQVVEHPLVHEHSVCCADLADSPEHPCDARAVVLDRQARGLLSIVDPDQQDRAGCRAEHRIGDAAKDQTAEPASAVGRHRDQVSGPFAGAHHDHVGGISLGRLDFDRHAPGFQAARSGPQVRLCVVTTLTMSHFRLRCSNRGRGHAVRRDMAACHKRFVASVCDGKGPGTPESGM